MKQPLITVLLSLTHERLGNFILDFTAERFSRVVKFQFEDNRDVKIIHTFEGLKVKMKETLRQAPEVSYL